MRLNQIRFRRGHAALDDQALHAVDSKALRPLRRRMQVIFQDPFDSLNARHTVGDILAEPFVIHRIGDP